MDRPTTFWLGVIAFGLLGAGTLVSCVPHIQEDLLTRANAEVGQPDWLQLSVDGQELYAAGLAPSQEVKDAVIEQLSAVWGVTEVHDEVRLKLVVAGGEPEAEAELDHQPPSEEVPVARDLDTPEATDRTVTSTEAESVESAAPAEEAPRTTPEAAAPLSGIARAALDCQQQLDEKLEGQRIHFEFARTKLDESSYPLLDEIALIAKRCEVAIEVTGYTDSRGHPAHNQMLSRERAASVLAYLVEQGVPGDRLSAVGMGDQNPIADNGTLEGRRANRRIEFTASAEALNAPAEESGEAS